MSNQGLDRRSFLTVAVAAAAAPGALAAAQPANDQRRRPVATGTPVAISSSNGMPAVTKAVDNMLAHDDPLDAVIAGVKIVEDDPDDMSVGYGGLPNEEGVVQLDASVMHGPTHRAGSVAALENIKNPAAVAREVARRTDHVMLVGEGALKFARRMGFEEENLLTDRARRAWLRWKSGVSASDDWLSRDEYDLPIPSLSAPEVGGDGAPQAGRIPAEELFTYGTIHCSGLNENGDLAGVTTTSGLSWKLPGRTGDSPIIGAGLYTDNEVGSAGATGRGEAVIQICGARTIVQRMEAGDHPTDACLYALQMIADKTKAKRLLDDRGRPNFNVIFYALRKDGAYGSACMHEGRSYSVRWLNVPAQPVRCDYLFERS